MVLSKWGSKNMFLSYPDHHNYSNQDIERIKQDLKTHANSVIITTRKDFYKIYKKLNYINAQAGSVIIFDGSLPSSLKIRCPFHSIFHSGFG